MSSRELPLPTFLIIGAQKSATRWLRFNLGLHPDVFATPTEVTFFNDAQRFDELGVSWYRAQFEGWSGEPIVGEATPGYMFWRHRPGVCSERIRQVVPDVRLIAILRNPIDRAQSAMIHHIGSGGLPKDASLLDLVRQTRPERDLLGLITGGWYAVSLAPFMQRFGDQLLVLLHDEIANDPQDVYDRAARHIGASPEFAPPDLKQVRFSYRDRPGVRPSVTPELTLEQRRAVYKFFAADIAKLEKMLDRDLSMWNPDAGT